VPRVLVVDDEPRIVSFVSRALSAEGFQVDGALDGSRGLELARTGEYELVVLDLLLPSLDGVTLLQEIMEARPSQRVLVLSALSDVETKVRCLEFGASDYVSKPFSLAELLERLHAAIAASVPGGAITSCTSAIRGGAPGASPDDFSASRSAVAAVAGRPKPEPDRRSVVDAPEVTSLR
jgi:two-component system, OmpR family, response regulator